MSDTVEQAKSNDVGAGGDVPASKSPDVKDVEPASPAPPSPMPMSPAPPSPMPASSPAPQSPAAQSPSTQSPATQSPATQSPACQSPVPGSESPSPKAGGDTFRDRFKVFSKFGDTKSDGKHITLSQSDKWMKQAKVIDGKKITTTDTGIYFKKFKALKIGFEDYKKFLEDLGKNKKVDVVEMKNKMASCGAPGLTGIHQTQSVQAAAVERLTDTSRYTGSHRQRFDETGKGKGIAGRKDLPEGSGYVHGYTNKDTYRKNR